MDSLLNWTIVHKDGQPHKNEEALSHLPETPGLSEVESGVKEFSDPYLSEVTDLAGEMTAMDFLDNSDSMFSLTALSTTYLTSGLRSRPT